MFTQRMLFLRGGALGDFLLTLPVLRAVREAIPGVRISLLASAAHGAFASWLGLADEVRNLDSAGFAPFFNPAAPAGESWTAWLQQHQAAVSWLSDAQGTLHHRLCGLIPVIHRGIPRPAEPGPHAVQQLAAVLREALPGIDLSTLPGPALSLPEISPRTGALAIHAGSGSPRKNWPAENWAQLLAHPLIRGRWQRLLLISGEAERETGSTGLIAAAARDAGWTVQLAENLTLPALATALAGCAFFCGHDSGISHLADLLGVPGVALFGPGFPEVWAPPGRIRILQAPQASLQALSVTAAADFIAAMADSA